MLPRLLICGSAALWAAAAPNATLQVPAGITARNVPVIDPAPLVSIVPYQNFRSASLEDWHPSARSILIGTRFAESRQLHEVARPGGARSQLTFYTDPILSGRYRPGRPAEIAYSLDEGGSENYQIFLFNRQAGATRRLTDGVHRHEGMTWSPDGKLLAYVGNARNGRDTDLYLNDPDAGQERRITDLTGTWQIQDWSRDGGKILINHYLSVSESSLSAIEVASGKVTALTPATEPAASYAQAKWGADGRSLFAITDRGGEFLRLARLELASGRWTALSGAIPWDVESFDVSEDGGLLAFFSNEDGISKLHLLELASGKELTAPDLPRGTAGALRFRPGSREVGFAISWARSPNDVYSYDPASGRLERWTESEVGGLDPSTFRVPELVRFPTFDEVEGAGGKRERRTIPAFVVRPDARVHAGRRPVLISIHGGPEGQSRPRFLGSENYFLRELGCALIYPNVRGSTGYGRTYERLDNGSKREDSVKDIGALLDWIAAQEDLDPKRVLVYGGSYGGYMVLASLVHFSDRLAGGFDSVGISNFVTFLTNTQEYRRDLRRAEYGDERDPEMRRFLEGIAPTAHVARITKPLLVAQGANDPRVPLSESDQIVAALEGRGIPIWYIASTDEGHGFRKKSNTDYQMAVFVEFVKRFVLG